MDSIISLLVYGILFYVVFKLGEHAAYIRIALSSKQFREQISKASVNKESTTVIEKIGEQYYIYIDNEFVGQGPTMSHATNLVQDTIIKNPNKFGIMTVVVKE